MAYLSRILVVARQTAASDDLLHALTERATRGPVRITLLMPAPEIGREGREAGQPDLDAAVARMREAGLDVEGICGDHDPLEAVTELWRPGAFDEVVVSTLPGETSKWQRIDFPHTVARLTDMPVTHVVARAPGDHGLQPVPVRPREREPLGPLATLGWSGGARHAGSGS